MSKIIEIPLTKGLFALIEEKDFEIVGKHKWYARKGKNTYYATSTRCKTLHMHRLIMDVGDRLTHIDHKNSNGLDNRRDNLRLATCAQNNCNKRANKGTSNFKGIHWNKSNKKWTAQITKPGLPTKHIGNFISEIDAALAYNKAAKEMHGEFAWLNDVKQ